MSTGYQSNYPSTGYGSDSQLRNEFQKIQEALGDALSRSGANNSDSLPNSMHVDLDMDSNNILNVNSLDAQNVSIGGESIYDAIDNISKGYADQAEQSAIEATQEASRAGQEADRSKREADRAAKLAGDMSVGYQFAGDYAAGIEITEYNQILRDADGEFWRLSGQVELPYTTTGAGLPEDDAMTPLGDAVLRQDLANPDIGAAMVARGVVAVDSITDLLALPEGQRKEGLRYLVKGYYAGIGIGGGEFYWDASADKSTADGGKVIDPVALAGFDGTPPSRDVFLDAQGGGTGAGCFILLSVPNQMNYGCVGDGAFDDSDAVQRAIDAQVEFIDREHGITKSLYVYDSIDMSAATFHCDNKPIAYLTFGVDLTVTRYKKVGFPSMRNTYNTSFQVDGVNPDSVGIRVIDAHESMFSFHPQGITSFGVGIELLSTGPGLSYCEFHNIRTIGCFKHILFHTINNGWITENLFLKTKTVNYNNFAPEGMDLTGLGYNYICVDNKTTLTQAVENLTFIQPTLEGVHVSDHLSLENGTANYWVMISPRFEVPGGTFKTKGNIRITLIDPSFAHRVEGLIGSSKFQTYGMDAVGVDNAPLILGASSGDRSRQGIGLLNENLDFSGRFVNSFTPANPDDFVWNINKTGLYAKGLNAIVPEQHRLTINFNNQYIRWGKGSSAVTSREYSQIQSVTAGATMAIDLTADSVRPYQNDVVNLGGSDRRWNNIFSTTGTISTSDERSKQDVLPLNEAEKNVAVKIKNLIRSFRFKGAVADKGDNARIHFGVIAQDVADAFTSEGLDPHRYGLFCYDEWEATEEVLDENGEVVTPYSEAGDRFGIRYDELLAFIISAL